MTINFDLDGTLADLYGVENWLDYLLKGDEYPYSAARPLVNMSLLARLLNKLQKQGYTINIISWLSKNSTKEYDVKVTNAKRKWLKKHLKSVKFDNIYIVPYGTPKHTLSNGILFDDEQKNRDNWGAGAYDVNNIIGVLKGFI
jgi:phosphoglycolate phosphatase-like HAD superfamily hydrolase